MTDLDRGADAAPGAWSLEDVYDAETLALIDGTRRGPSGTGALTRTGPGAWNPPADAPAADDEAAVEPASGSTVGDDEVPSPLTSDTRARTARRGRGGLAALALSGAMIGVAEVLDPDGLQPAIEEFVPDSPDPESMPVQFICVPGNPRASRLIIRPWLFGR